MLRHTCPHTHTIPLLHPPPPLSTSFLSRTRPAILLHPCPLPCSTHSSTPIPFPSLTPFPLSDPFLITHSLTHTRTHYIHIPWPPFLSQPSHSPTLAPTHPPIHSLTVIQVQRVSHWKKVLTSTSLCSVSATSSTLWLKAPRNTCPTGTQSEESIGPWSSLLMLLPLFLLFW